MSIATELRRAMLARGVTYSALAATTGTPRPTIANMTRGTSLGPHETVVRLAEYLDWDPLVKASLAARLRTCEVCGREFYADQRRARKFCSVRCNSTAVIRRRKVKQREERALSSQAKGARLALFQEAVAAYCRGCEPEGLCRDAACALRPCSPLPLARQRAA